MITCGGHPAVRRVSRGGYALLTVLVVLAGVALTVGILSRLTAFAQEDVRLRDHADQARWAADAAVEEAIRQLSRQAGGGPQAEKLFHTRSNDCAAEVVIADGTGDSFRIEAEATYAPEGVDQVRLPARARVAAVVKADRAARRLAIVGWTEGWPADAPAPVVGK